LKELKTIKTRVLLRLKPLALAHAARRTHQRGSCPSQDPSALRPASSRTRCLLSPGTNRYCNSVGSCCPAGPKIKKYPTSLRPAYHHDPTPNWVLPPLGPNIFGPCPAARPNALGLVRTPDPTEWGGPVTFKIWPCNWHEENQSTRRVNS
jgi:hypothetical protein